MREPTAGEWLCVRCGHPEGEHFWLEPGPIKNGVAGCLVKEGEKECECDGYLDAE